MFTKGEWRETMLAGERIIYVDKGENGSEVICSNVRHWNAPIIKAAPDMYKALEGIHTKVINGDMTLDDNNWFNLLKALAKARGE